MFTVAVDSWGKLLFLHLPAIMTLFNVAVLPVINVRWFHVIPLPAGMMTVFCAQSVKLRVTWPVAAVPSFFCPVVATCCDWVFWVCCRWAGTVRLVGLTLVAAALKANV